MGKLNLFDVKKDPVTVGWDGAKRNPSIRCFETFEAGIPLHSIPAYDAVVIH